MKGFSRFATSLSHAGVVGTVHSAASLGAARKIRSMDCDWLELRVDNFFPYVSEIHKAALELKLPKIVTVRHFSEGGAAKGMTAQERRGLYRDFLPAAGLVDIELRWARGMKDIIDEARRSGVGVILSCHDFRGMPTLPKLKELKRRAEDAGADVLKVAAMTRTARDLAKMIEFLANEKGGLPLAVMGMGEYGKVSRLALAQAGSCLNYGYLGSANASGQWPVAVLKARIAELNAA